jgi:hypothetical protein
MIMGTFLLYGNDRLYMLFKSISSTPMPSRLSSKELNLGRSCSSLVSYRMAAICIFPYRILPGRPGEGREDLLFEPPLLL